jgi:threonine/homoserine/homoserine lactone efflux protein
MFSLFIKGCVIGISIAAPVGPIGVLCINRTLKTGLMAGLSTGLGAALADAVYGCIAGFGLVAVSQFLLAQQMWIRLIGGAFLLYLGIKTFASSTSPKEIPDQAKTLWRDFTSTFFLTLTNPMTIISFIAIYASLGVVEANANYQEALIVVIGVFAGSLLWWLLLSTSINLIRHKLSKDILIWINRFSGLILFAFGIFSLISAF